MLEYNAKDDRDGEEGDVRGLKQGQAFRRGHEWRMRAGSSSPSKLRNLVHNGSPPNMATHVPLS